MLSNRCDDTVCMFHINAHYISAVLTYHMEFFKECILKMYSIMFTVSTGLRSSSLKYQLRNFC